VSTYYVDSNATYAANHANSGTAPETPWGGVGGIQRALGLIQPGEELKHKAGAEVDWSKLVKVVCTGTLAGAISVDNFVYCFEWSTTPTGAEASGGQGYVVYVTGKTYYIHVTAGTWVTGAAHCISKENAPTYTNYIEAITVTKPGPTVITNGTTAGRVRITGVNASWEDDGTQVVWDGMTLASYGLAYLYNYYHLKNIYAKRMVARGFNGDAYNISENCRSSTNATGGWSEGGYNLYSRCEADGNTTFGISCAGNGCIKECAMIGNTTNGLVLTAVGTSVLDCILHNNTQNGILVSGNGATIRGNIIDGNGYNGVSVTAGVSTFVTANRITYNGGSTSYYGINGDAANRAWEDENVFYKNGTDADGVHTHDILTPGTNTLTGGHSLAADNATECGYTSRDDDDFNLTEDAILRSTALVLP
jgi:hypothetical protein